MSGNSPLPTPQTPPENTENTVASAASARVVAIPKDSIPAPANTPTARVKTESASAQRIGDILRKARTDKNEDLYLIAEYLCIKPNFLVALENSQYDALPADAYVIGFLRTYANFLGIDGKEAVDRYRYEMAGRRRKPVLSMPTPVSEGRAPTGIIMVAATIALLLIYALWYGISSSNRAEVTKAPPLPTVAQPVPATAPTDAAAGLTAPVPTATVNTPIINTPTASSVTTPITATTPAGIALGAAPAPQSLAPAPSNAADISAKDNTAKDTAKAAAAATPDAKSDDKKPVDTHGSHLVIRATQSSWIMITDSTGKAVVDKVLHPGESYNVPNKDGLSLTTGNGSGITLSLDGNDLPKLANGAPHVIRDIPLDTDHLTSGVSGN